jgi:nitroreductase
MPSFEEVKIGLDMPLVEAMETQRAIRRLRTDPVDDDIVVRLLELALKAPTGGNQQNWEFVVVRDPEVKHQLARANRQVLPIFNRAYARKTRNDLRMRKIADAVQWQADHFEEIPVVIVACARGFRPWFPQIGASSYYGSIYPSIQNLLLAARSLGLGAALITLPLWSTWQARRTLGLPTSVTPVAVVPLGWPQGRYGPTTRRPVGEVTHLDRFGNRAFLPPGPAR